jgi:phosphate starvation-inducible PhoH-like protein
MKRNIPRFSYFIPSLYRMKPNDVEYTLGLPSQAKHFKKVKKEENKRNRRHFKQQQQRVMGDQLLEFYCSNEDLVSVHDIPTSPPKKNNQFTTPRTKSQFHYISLLENNEQKIIIANGPAGTGKTLFATEYGIKCFLSGSFEKLIFTRPSVSVDEDLGYLPGTMEDKMAPWLRPIYDILYQNFTSKEIKTLLENKSIEIAPLGFMRGRTFKNTWVVADEMQNSTVSQMKMLLTRLGENSRMVITGDLDQHDKPLERNGLEDFLGRFKGKRSTSISSLEFDREDIQREEVIKEVLDLYSFAKANELEV